MEFKEGGAFDFASTFERLKERLKQAVDVAGVSPTEGVDTGDGRGAGALSGVNLASVHLDELPTYEDSGRYTRVPENIPSPPPPAGRGSVGGESTVSTATANRSSPLSSPREESFQAPPTEPPPGYEEVQQNSVADELERRLRSPRLEPSEQ